MRGLSNATFCNPEVVTQFYINIYFYFSATLKFIFLLFLDLVQFLALLQLKGEKKEQLE